uniref:Uncharacterized protein n=1 Tax=Romanomermis culicivorax TaxID=13658 RepID=A0A915IXR1_ROMCU
MRKSTTVAAARALPHAQKLVGGFTFESNPGIFPAVINTKTPRRISPRVLPCPTPGSDTIKKEKIKIIMDVVYYRT